MPRKPPASGISQRGVDADHLAVEIEGRSARQMRQRENSCVRLFWSRQDRSRGPTGHTAERTYSAKAASFFGDTSGRFSFDDQLLQSGFDHGDLFVDLTDWQAEVVPRSCPGPELERKPLPMLPEIVKRATVLMPDLQLND
jgi:hypothetical protein